MTTKTPGMNEAVFAKRVLQLQQAVQEGDGALTYDILNRCGRAWWDCRSLDTRLQQAHRLLDVLWQQSPPALLHLDRILCHPEICSYATRLWTSPARSTNYTRRLLLIAYEANSMGSIPDNTRRSYHQLLSAVPGFQAHPAKHQTWLDALGPALLGDQWFMLASLYDMTGPHDTNCLQALLQMVPVDTSQSTVTDGSALPPQLMP